MATYTKGYLRVSLLTVPVKMNAANKSDGAPSLNQLHEACGNRIKCPKHCPACGVDVPADQVVSAFEHAKGQYVPVDPSQFKAASDKTIALTSFVPESAVDPVYLRGDNHYLTADGSVGEKSLALLYQAMFDAKVIALGTVTLLGKRRHVALRALPGGVLVMLTLHYATSVRRPDEFANVAVKASDAEYGLMRQLVGGMAGTFDIDACRDDYGDRLRAYVAAKLAGQEAPQEQETPAVPVVDLMATLKASLAARVAVPA